MSKIERPKRINEQDVSKESREAVAAVGDAINLFMEQVYTAMNKRVTISENLNMEYKQFKITVDISGNPVKTVKFNSNLVTRVYGMQVVRAFGGIPTNQPFITFVDNSGLITIQNVSGLVADTEYTLVVLLLGN